MGLKLNLGYCPHSITYIYIYIYSLNMTRSIDSYWVGAVPNLNAQQEPKTQSHLVSRAACRKSAGVCSSY